VPVLIVKEHPLFAPRMALHHQHQPLANARMKGMSYRERFWLTRVTRCI
jgi:hypothetical protein